MDNPAQSTVAVTSNDIYYVFPDDTAFAGERIVETLKDLMQLVHGIIEAFANLVRNRG